MKIPLSFAELHGPLFLAGKNFGQKLDKYKHPGIVLEYDTDRHWLQVTWSKNEAWVPLSNVSSMTPVGEPVKTATQTLAAAIAPTPELARGKLSAQVETPQSHVHAGPGAGVTGQEKRKVIL